VKQKQKLIAEIGKKQKTQLTLRKKKPTAVEERAFFVENEQKYDRYKMEN